MTRLLKEVEQRQNPPGEVHRGFRLVWPPSTLDLMTSFRTSTMIVGLIA